MPKTIKVVFTNILEYKSGSASLTKQYMNDHPGSYPVYSAKTIGETKVGEIDSYMFDVEGLQLTTNGANAGTWLYREKHKFSLNGDARLYYPRKEFEDVLDIKYLFYALQFAFKSKDFDWRTKATINNTQNIEISLPVLPNGTYDLETQKKLAKQYQEVENKKQVLLNKVEELKKVKIFIEEDKTIQYKLISLNDMVIHCNGNANYTKEWCNLHAGAIPVYSANNKEPFAYSDTADYDGRFLTYSKNGCAGYIKIIDEKFSINGDRCVIKLNSGFEKVNLQYLKHYLEPIFRKNVKGRIGINGKNEYTKINSTIINKLNISVPIPIDDNGMFDTEKQQELAMKYATIETIKENICNQIYNLTNIIID